MKSHNNSEPKIGTVSTAGDKSPATVGNGNVIATEGGVIKQQFHPASFVGGIVTGVIGSVLTHLLIKALS